MNGINNEETSPVCALLRIGLVCAAELKSNVL